MYILKFESKLQPGMCIFVREMHDLRRASVLKPPFEMPLNGLQTLIIYNLHLMAVKNRH